MERYLTAAAMRTWLELRHARLRLAIAENELAWAQAQLKNGMAPETALEILEEVMDALYGAPFATGNTAP